MAENTEKTDGTLAVKVDFDVTLYWYKADGSTRIRADKSELVTLRSETGWIQYSLEAIAPEGAVLLVAGVCRRWISGPAGNIYIDDYELTYDLGNNILLGL